MFSDLCLSSRGQKLEFRAYTFDFSKLGAYLETKNILRDKSLPKFSNPYLVSAMSYEINPLILRKPVRYKRKLMMKYIKRP